MTVNHLLILSMLQRRRVPTTAAALSRRISQNVRTVRDSIHVLQGDGLVETKSKTLKNEDRPGRPPVLYVITERGVETLRGIFDKLGVS